jgi:hypothetical protein
MSNNDLRPWNGPLYAADCDPRVQQKVQDRLDEWYVRDGRYRPDHPYHSSYTGLAAKYASEDTTDDN